MACRSIAGLMPTCRKIGAKQLTYSQHDNSPTIVRFLKRNCHYKSIAIKFLTILGCHLWLKITASTCNPKNKFKTTCLKLRDHRTMTITINRMWKWQKCMIIRQIDNLKYVHILYFTKWFITSLEILVWIWAFIRKRTVLN